MCINDSVLNKMYQYIHKTTKTCSFRELYAKWCMHQRLSNLHPPSYWKPVLKIAAWARTEPSSPGIKLTALPNEVSGPAKWMFSLMLHNCSILHLAVQMVKQLAWHQLDEDMILAQAKNFSMAFHWLGGCGLQWKLIRISIQQLHYWAAVPTLQISGLKKKTIPCPFTHQPNAVPDELSGLIGRYLQSNRLLYTAFCSA